MVPRHQSRKQSIATRAPARTSKPICCRKTLGSPGSNFRGTPVPQQCDRRHRLLSDERWRQHRLASARRLFACVSRRGLRGGSRADGVDPFGEVGGSVLALVIPTGHLLGYNLFELRPVSRRWRSKSGIRSCCVVSCGGKVVSTFVRGEGVDDAADGVPEPFDGSPRSLAQEPFSLAKAFSIGLKSGLTHALTILASDRLNATDLAHLVSFTRSFACGRNPCRHIPRDSVLTPLKRDWAHRTFRI